MPAGLVSGEASSSACGRRPLRRVLTQPFPFHGVHAPLVSVPLFIRKLVLGSGASLVTSFHLSCFFKGPSSKHSHMGIVASDVGKGEGGG